MRTICARPMGSRGALAPQSVIERRVVLLYQPFFNASQQIRNAGSAVGQRVGGPGVVSVQPVKVCGPEFHCSTELLVLVMSFAQVNRQALQCAPN